MKKVFLIISVFLINSVQAQTDTVAYPDPWYLFQPLSEAPAVSRGSFYPDVALWHRLQSFYSGTPVNIYGVACVIDTIHSDKGNPDSTYLPMLYRYEGAGIHETGFPIRFFSVVDSTSFLGYTKQCKFKYVYSSIGGDNQSGERVYNCFEFYFNRPHRSDTICSVNGYQDSVYVGRYADGNLIDGHSYMAWELKMITMTELPYYAGVGINRQGEQIIIYRYALNEWGPFFPIVRLRCVQPELRLGRNWYDTTVVSWRTVEAPDGYELSLGDYGSDPDDGTIVALPDSCHSYAFPRLLSNHHYSVWVRKGCAYPNFDTVAWSPWSNPVSFFGPTVPPNPGDTTAIDKVPTPQAFTLSPNPAGGTVTVSADFALQRVDLYNTAGALVLSLPASGNQMDISLEGLLPGTYVVAVATAAGTATRKLTVER